LTSLFPSHLLLRPRSFFSFALFFFIDSLRVGDPAILVPSSLRSNLLFRLLRFLRRRIHPVTPWFLPGEICCWLKILTTVVILLFLVNSGSRPRPFPGPDQWFPLCRLSSRKTVSGDAFLISVCTPATGSRLVHLLPFAFKAFFFPISEKDATPHSLNPLVELPQMSRAPCLQRSPRSYRPSPACPRPSLPLVFFSLALSFFLPRRFLAFLIAKDPCMIVLMRAFVLVFLPPACVSAAHLLCPTLS